MKRAATHDDAKHDTLSKRLRPNMIDISNTNVDYLQDPMQMSMDMTEPESTSTSSIQSQWANQFCVQFQCGRLLQDVVTYLSALNKSSKGDIVCTLLVQDGKTYLTMWIVGHAPSHFTKCNVRCDVLNDDRTPVSFGKQNQTLSQFVLGFSQVEQAFAGVDATRTIRFIRNNENISLEYDTKNNVHISVALHLRESNTDLKTEEIYRLDYEYQLLVPTSAMSDFFNQARNIGGSLVKMRIYRKEHVAAVLALELETRESEVAQHCSAKIPFYDDETVPTEMESDAPVQRSRPSPDSICTPENLCCLSALYKVCVHQIINMKTAPAFTIHMNWRWADNKYGSPMPVRFSIETDDLSVSIYLDAFIVPSLGEEIQSLYQKKSKNEK